MEPKTINRDQCLQHIDETVFKLRPSDYQPKHPKWPGLVGLEIEMLVVKPGGSDPDKPQVSQLFTGPHPTSKIIESLGRQHQWELNFTADDQGVPRLLTAKMQEGDMISFEPGGQIEISTKPYPCLAEANRRLREAQTLIEAGLNQKGFVIVQTGINPWHTKDEITLQMRKSRYLAMDQHFAAISPYGQRMMRQTCTIQVNLDFGPNETILAKRYLASELLAPFAAAIFCNSPVVDGKNQGIRGFRTRVWRHADPSRTGLPAYKRLLKDLSRKEAVQIYFDFALQSTVVFVESAGYLIPPKPITFSQLLEGALPDVKPQLVDFTTHLSLLFPEVRPRGFLELRSADAQPRAFQGVPAVFWTGLLYSDKILDQLIDLLVPYVDQIPQLMGSAEDGLNHPILAKVSREVMNLAQKGFGQLASCYKEGGAETEFAAYRDQFTERGRTPADDVLDALAFHNQTCLSLDAYRALEDKWMSVVAI